MDCGFLHMGGGTGREWNEYDSKSTLSGKLLCFGCEEKYYEYCNYNKIEIKVEKAIAPKGLLVHLYFPCFIAHCEEETF